MITYVFTIEAAFKTIWIAYVKFLQMLLPSATDSQKKPMKTI